MPFLALKDRGNRLSINFLIDFFHFQDQYEFIYSALSEYLDSFDAYSNFE